MFGPMLKYAKVRDVKSPSRGTAKSAGIDFFIPSDWNNTCDYVLNPFEHINIPAGIHVGIPEGHVLIFHNKSGIALRRKLIVMADVIDEDYQGEIHLSVANVSNEVQMIEPGMKLIQGILTPVNYATPVGYSYRLLYDNVTERGKGGFGSTGLD